MVAGSSPARLTIGSSFLTITYHVAMKLSLLVTLLSLMSAVEAQTVKLYQPLGQVKAFLQLSDSQLQTILANNDDYMQWSFGKQARIQQVQNEIAAETAKDSLDPLALGLRYVEIQTICREIRDRVVETRTRNADVLNQDQKTKLKILDDAMKLAPVIAEAQAGNLLGGYSYGLPFFPSSFVSTAVTGVFSPANGCSLPVPLVFDPGGFTNVRRPAASSTR